MSAPSTNTQDPPATPAKPTRARWDRCGDCTHFRDDHDGAGCAVTISGAGYATGCDCFDFVDGAP